ncbi:LysR family transcriptional regulator [Pararoseomonas sp. SCSIO 73927]|uniref:LysR family transcriptional regulator n=1 Tax=Pararoseomonas sp. SCSIO 73927 TaxID=3114537 RepID=UPI0030CC706A
MAPDINALSVFVAVAEARGFRAAAERLGVTPSAVSQSIRRLETAVGAALLRRSTRSVALTEAGQRLLAEAAPAIAALQRAMDGARSADGTPRGPLRLAVSSIAEGFLSGPLLAGYGRAFPEVQLDVFVTDEEMDIVAAGFDAGVRLGEVIERDMVAVAVSADQHQLAVCSPAYLAERGAPAHPRELAEHRCIGWRPAPGTPPYRWEFVEDGREFAVDVAPEVTTNDMGLMIRLALSGGGITFGMAESFEAYLERGELVAVLEEFSGPFAGFFLYYPSRRGMSPELRALIDHVRARGRRPETPAPPGAPARGASGGDRRPRR